ncbi:MAG: radical SAM protein [Lachnospiraceae bacterium]|nr:radical SAM protein [Lachnospiraceae bacterium]
MKIQSLSIVVPAKKCINHCKFCVACMRDEPYKDQLDSNKPFFDLYQKDYIRRLEFARDNGCNTVMLTGNCEPQQNRQFLEMFGTLNNSLDKPFRWIEMQTTGTLIDNHYLRFLRNHVGVSTISMSLASLDSDVNAMVCTMKHPVNINSFCSEVKRYDFNLRLSINLTKDIENKWQDIDALMKHCRDVLGADQITFRVLYTSGLDTPQDKWIAENGASAEYVDKIRNYIKDNGTVLGQLDFGAIKYSVHNMSTVLDDDCMAQTAKEEYKYLILRPNCKLYSRWDDPASLIF